MSEIVLWSDMRQLKLKPKSRLQHIDFLKIMIEIIMKVCNKNPETWIVNEVMESDVIMEDMVEDREEDMVEIPTTVDMDKGYIIFSSLIIVPQFR